MRSLIWKTCIIAILQMEKKQTNSKKKRQGKEISAHLGVIAQQPMAGWRSGTWGCADIQESNGLNFQQVQGSTEVPDQSYLIGFGIK